MDSPQPHVAGQAHLSMDFSRQECLNGLPFPLPGGLPDPGITPASPALAGGLFTTEPSGKPFHQASYLNLFLLRYVSVRNELKIMKK